MKTPIYDFAREYAESNSLRLHMPGHKGRSFLGCEDLDITEIDGADSLYHASGIILESEKNATSLFGSAHTFYSAEGSLLELLKLLLKITAQQHKTVSKIIATEDDLKNFCTDDNTDIPFMKGWRYEQQPKKLRRYVNT